MKKEKIKITIFADGSSLGNPGPGGWGVVLVFDSMVAELGGHASHTTNNKMELTAAIKALEHVIARNLSPKTYNLILYTDSAYVINGITKWVFGWEKNNWKTSTKEPVLNQELWQKLLSLTKAVSVSWKYVKGHSGIPGNERVDEIATSFSSGSRSDLFTGPLQEYGVDVQIVSSTNKNKITKKKSTRKGKALSYLSLVNDILIKHETWVECEARVKSVRGAKFKKAMSKADETDIKVSWGLSN